MGDRVSVTLSIPTAQADEAEAIMKEKDGEFGSVEYFDTHCEYEFEEVEYGDLKCEKFLTAAGIAWMKTWGRGCAYNPGTAWAMFREDGSLHSLNMVDASPEEILSPFLDLLEEPEALLEALKIEKAKLMSPSWENQVEYGKRYLARQLIDPPPAPVGLGIPMPF